MADAPAMAPGARPAAGFAVAVAIVAFGFVGSRLLGLLRTVAIADAFGSSPERAAWQVAFLIPDTIFLALAGATMGSAFIPVFARLFRQEGPDRAWELASSALTLVTAATAVLCVAAFVLAPVIVPPLAPGLGVDTGNRAELVDEAVKLTRLMLLSPLLFSVSGMITGILNARQQFFLPALAPMAYNLAIIFGALVLAKPWGITGLAVGVVAGAGFHLLTQLPGLFRERMRFRPRLGLADAATREVMRLMGPRVVGLAAIQLNLMVATFFASKVDTASINVIGYAFIVAQLPLGVFGMALATAAFPRLADQVAQGDVEGLHRTVGRVLRLILFLTIPTAVGLALLREPVTVLLLQGGEFTAADSVAVGKALGWYCLGIVPMAALEIHSRGFYAMGDTRTPVTMTIVAVVVNAGLSAMLWQDYGYSGLAFAASAAAWLEWALVATVYARRTGGTAWMDDLEHGTRIALAAGIMGVGVAAVAGEFAWGGRMEALIAVAGLGCGGALAYAAIVLALRLPEATELPEMLRARLHRGGPEASSEAGLRR